MKIILHDQRPDESGILALRAAQSVMKTGYAVGSTICVGFKNGGLYAIRVNKDSVSVWPQREEEQPT